MYKIEFMKFFMKYVEETFDWNWRKKNNKTAGSEMKLGHFCWPWTHVTQMNSDPGPSKLIEKSQNSFKLVKQFSYRFQKGRNLID